MRASAVMTGRPISFRRTRTSWNATWSPGRSRPPVGWYPESYGTSFASIRSGWGQGRAWPLLTGERGHYELAAGRPVEPFVRALEGFAHGIGLLPEQVWDQADQPDRYLFLGRPTGGACPLMWAHAEYIKLLRS